MRKRIHIGLAVLFSAAVGAIAWWGFISHEQSYQGRPLSAWMQDLDYNETISPAVTNALRHFGRDALPSIIRDLKSQDSSLQYRMLKWANDNDVIKHVPMSASIRRDRAMLACTIIGPDAKAAIPALADLLNQPHPAYEAAITLARIGAPEAVSVLVNSSSGTNASVQVRIYVAGALGQCVSNAAVVVPALLRFLQDSNSIVRSYAAFSLGQIRQQPTVAVPVLIAALADTDPTVRLAACRALGNFTMQAQSDMVPLFKALNDPAVSVREAAAIALARIDSHNPSTVAKVLPLLIEAITRRRFEDAAIKALTECGSLAQPAVPTLLDCLNETDPPDRDLVVKALLSIDPQISIPP